MKQLLWFGFDGAALNIWEFLLNNRLIGTDHPNNNPTSRWYFVYAFVCGFVLIRFIIYACYGKHSRSKHGNVINYGWQITRNMTKTLQLPILCELLSEHKKAESYYFEKLLAFSEYELGTK